MFTSLKDATRFVNKSYRVIIITNTTILNTLIIIFEISAFEELIITITILRERKEVLINFRRNRLYNLS